ncbi:DegT/DnrJ/EryC1/StrS aminotransferase family protein [Hujiaoplasma nucleasis]|uniref:DegT/DnrJ/EryC1/StrS aminotransferase family protein n=1 Tax=Hujiaoplasma nucleasis TaxID=2725268 RepID=A0A7L6N2Q5_9MOLU|nr:DegT/DnrJ/EryC1/StrS aminotransferase family protein [Hujiaoplasma nucleasis]QLY39831.1 DegT/DnrJ/EryC1/StrS aminotransferase family protein [Hujiaoplasma nucleasis]
MIERNIPFSPPDITEEEISEVKDTLSSGWITTGPKTKALEKKLAEYVGVKKAVCLNSATAAMELSLRILGIGPGDEVITSAYTYTASASVIHHVGAKIVLVDTAPNSFEMDYYKLKDAITEKTKVIIPVDIAGVMCDYNKIISIVNEKKYLFKANNSKQKSIGRVAILADAAHSLGALHKGKRSGQFADISCFSFHAVKNLTTAEGGAVVWTNTFGMTDEEFYKEFMLYSLHGQSKDAFSKTQKGAWEYDIIYLGYKTNMTDVLAAIGLVQLKRYDDLLIKRQNIIKIYEKFIDKKLIDTIKHTGSDFKSSGHLLLCNLIDFTLEERNKVIFEMASRGISTNVHYKPLPLFSAYKALGFNIDDYPQAYKKYVNEISLPLYSTLSEDEIIYIATSLNEVVNNIKSRGIN